MRRVLTLALAGVFSLMLSAAAQAQTYTFTADLSGGHEVPGVTTGSGGTATVTLDTTANTVSWVIDVYNLPTGVTASHFHVGAAGVAGPVVVNITVVATTSNDFRLTGTASASDLVARAAQGVSSWDDFEQAMLNGDVYVNVHSQANPGGEVRGNLVRVP